MNPSKPFTGARLLLIASAIAALVAVACYLNFASAPGGGEPLPASDGAPLASASAGPRDALQTPEPPVELPTAGNASAAATPGQPHPAAANAAPSAATPIVRDAEGRIDPASVGEFAPLVFPGGPPDYEGEPVTAYVGVPSSGRKVALTVNQLGEFPRIDTAPSEKVEIRLVFATTAPGTPIAVAAQDGGKLHTGKLSAAQPLNAERQLAFAYTVSPNPGMHRVSVTTPAGELKTLEFWAGPPAALQREARL